MSEVRAYDYNNFPETVENNEETKEAENVVESTTEDVILEVTDGIDYRSWKNLEWWNEIPKQDQFRLGDIVFLTNGINKFGVFVEPARKEGLLRIRLFKKHTKVDVYSRDWFINFDVVELVKRKSRLSRGYVETDMEFIKRADL